ncbi:unnamed protein product [Chilo suppressalis]|uniref:Uncharacterized protein n=1 Tax=Chilo suppressalis TaxID=168631 RepID=A0ABN8B749_CHISP|nr:unnamed protein product [Chilo suppressalis]
MILVAVLVIVLLAFRVWHVMESQEEQDTKVLANGSDSGFAQLWHHFVEQYGIPLGHVCVSFVYSVYTRFTLINVTIFILKYVPTGLYMYKFLRNIYTTSRERIKQKQMEIEDIQLQIQIVNNKLCVRDAEFTERAEQLRREADRLRQVRARVRKIIATDEALRRALDDSAALDSDDVDVHTTPEEDRKFIVEMLKGLKNVTIPERHEKMECGEYAQISHNSPENSVYSSLSDLDIKQDCRVKIVKVTNVYKVAYLKHFIKQKRLRRAQKHALLKKRMECIKNLLEDWQKSLSTVISNNMTILNMESRIDAASQEAMGDYSKPTLREYSDSDSDLRNGYDDATHDEYNHSWAQNTFQNCSFNYEDIQEPGLHREFCEPQDFSDVKYPYHVIQPCECHGPRGDRKLCVLPEETISQMAIEKIKNEEDCQTYADAVV